MHPVSRSLLSAAIIALSGVAACGDKIVVPGGGGDTPTPPDNTPVVTDVRVSPSTAELSVNSTQTFSAAVLGTNITNFGVTWSVADQNVATITSAGVLTAKAPGTTSVIATSAQNPNVRGFATVVVRPDISAGVAINAITGANGAAVNVDSVAGQIAVGLNITQGTGSQRLDSVKVFLRCGTTETEVYRQTFTGGTTPPGSVQAPINTAAFNATTGAPTFPNATGCTFVARGYTAGGQTVAQTSTAINLRNLDMARVTVTTAKQASTTGGALWNGGDVTVAVMPVIYSGQVLSSSTVSLTATTPDVINKAQTISTNAGRGSVTFSGSTNSTATNTAIGGLTGADARVGVSFLGSTGQTVTLPTNIVTIYPVENPAANNFFRVDNEAPADPTASDLDVTASRQWTGASFTFTSSGGTPTVAITGGADQGVNENTIQYYAIPVGSFTALTGGTSSSATTCAAPSGAVTIASGQTAEGRLAQTATTNGYRLRVVITDKLGNVRCEDLSTGETFGFDPIVPTLSANTTTAAGGVRSDNIIQSVAVAGGRAFVFDAADTLSGFFRSDSVLRTTVIRNDSASTCVVGSFNATTGVCSAVWSPASVNVAGQPEGYYTITTFARDVAGNVSPTASRTGILDVTAPVVTAGPTQVAAVAGLGTPSMTVSATDNIDLNTIEGRTAYSFTAGTIDPILVGTSQAVGTFGLPGTTSATATVSGGTAFRSLTLLSSITDGTAVETVTPILQTLVTDQANNFVVQNGGGVAFTATTATPSPIIAASVTSSTGTAPTTGTGTQSLQFRVRTAGTTTDQPFSSVQLYQVNADGSLTAVGAAQTLSAVSVNPANERVYTYTLPSVARTAAPGTNYVVIGTNAAGFAVITPVFAS